MNVEPIVHGDVTYGQYRLRYIDFLDRMGFIQSRVPGVCSQYPLLAGDPGSSTCLFFCPDYFLHFTRRFHAGCIPASCVLSAFIDSYGPITRKFQVGVGDNCGYVTTFDPKPFVRYLLRTSAQLKGNIMYAQIFNYLVGSLSCDFLITMEDRLMQYQEHVMFCEDDHDNDPLVYPQYSRLEANMYHYLTKEQFKSAGLYPVDYCLVLNPRVPVILPTKGRDDASPNQKAPHPCELR